MKLFRINSISDVLRAFVAWPLLAAGLYFAAALVGSLVPVNGHWKHAKDGITIYLHDNGIHTSIIIPCQEKSDIVDIPDGHIKDFRCLFPTEHLPQQNFPTRFQMIGWGDREVYLNTPTWSDFKFGTAATAFIGSGSTLVHVNHLIELPQNDLRALKVTAEEFGAIIAAIHNEASIEANTISDTLAPIRGYGDRDVFYAGLRSQAENYSALYTCNNWVSDILAKAGIKTGLWTPLPFGVMWWH